MVAEWFLKTSAKELIHHFPWEWIAFLIIQMADYLLVPSGATFSVVFAWFGLVSSLSFCFFACLRTFTDWCRVHRQQSREQKKFWSYIQCILLVKIGRLAPPHFDSMILFIHCRFHIFHGLRSCLIGPFMWLTQIFCFGLMSVRWFGVGCQGFSVWTGFFIWQGGLF